MQRAMLLLSWGVSYITGIVYCWTSGCWGLLPSAHERDYVQASWCILSMAGALWTMSVLPFLGDSPVGHVLHVASLCFLYSAASSYCLTPSTYLQAP